MNIRHLNYFLAVIRRGSFSAAAAEIGVSQSALSQAVSVLEAELGSALFDRSSGGVRLTAAGREFQLPARDALAAIGRGTEAVARVDRLSGGSLEIACPGTLGIDPIARLVATFHAEFPEVRVRIRDLPERPVDEKQLFDLGVDLAITFTELVDASMDTIPLDPLRLLAVLPRPANTSVTLTEVLRRGLVTTPGHSAPRRFLAAQFDTQRIEEAIVVEVTHPEAVLQMVLDGAGATIVPAGQAASAASMPGLAVCSIHPEATLDIVAVMPKTSRSVAAHQFMRVCRESVVSA